MKTIECECGKKLLVIPDLRRMNEAIEKHIKSSAHAIDNKILEPVEHMRLRNLLAQKVLEVAAKNGKYNSVC